jgi:regulator of nonsense transcripts 1
MSDDEPDDLGFLDDFASESQLSQLNDNDDDDNDNVVSSLDSLLNEVEAQLSDEDDDDDVEKKKKSYDFDEGEDSENEEEEEMKVQELPEHACAYCNIFDAECVVKCLDCEDKGGCKWFCNGRPHGSGYSCIVQHLVRGRHKQVQLHPSSPLGDTVLECYSTGNRNVFQLGFVRTLQKLPFTQLATHKHKHNTHRYLPSPRT